MTKPIWKILLVITLLFFVIDVTIRIWFYQDLSFDMVAFTTIINALSSSAIIGVVVGAGIGLLSPLVSGMVERKKRKGQIRSKFTYLISMFCNHKKIFISSSTSSSFSSRRVALSWAAVAISVQPNDLTKNQRVFEYHTKLTENNSKQVMRQFDLIIDIEGKLQSLINEMPECFSSQQVAEVKKVIDPLIEDINTTDASMYDVSNLTEAQMQQIELTITQEVKTRTRAIHAEGVKVIGELSEILR